MRARLLTLLSLMLLWTVAAHADTPRLSDAKAQKAAAKCQKAIDQSGAKLFAGKLKSLEACSGTVLGCIQTQPGDAGCLQKATSKCSKALLDAIPQAEVSASAKIVKSCGDPLRPADLLAGDGLGIGAQAAACNTDFGLNICTNLPTLAQCLVAEGSRGAERVFAAQQPRASELIQQVLSPLPLAYLPSFPGCQDCAQAPSDTIGKAVAACGSTLTKAGRTFAGTVAKGLGACIDKVFTCVQTKPGDAKCLAKAGSACDATVVKLAAARNTLGTTIDKKCADTGLLPFATLAAAAALNLDALADDCQALGAGPLGTLDDYVACMRRQHECALADVLRRTLPRTVELVDAGALGTAGALLDASTCPTTLPSTALGTRRAARVTGTFSMSRFFSAVTKVGTGIQAAKVAAAAPSSAPNAPRRIAFSQGAPSRFVPGTSQIVKVPYFGKLTKSALRVGAVTATPPSLIIGVVRGDFVVEDHLEIPLEDVAPDEQKEIDLLIDYADAPPSCVFDLALAVSEDGEVSDYTIVEQVADTVPPATATPVPTVAPTTTGGPIASPTATSTGAPGSTATLTPTATSATPTVTPTPIFAYALTTADDAVEPGHTATFRLTVTNLSNAIQSATLSLAVPNFTFYGAYGAGAVRPVPFSNVAAGASQSALINLAVTSGAQAPPDGTVITLTLTDTARGKSVARSVVTQSLPAADLELATTQATVSPGGAFGYTLAYQNPGLTPLADVELSFQVPSGASFVGAEGGGIFGVDGIVRWPLGALAAGATGQLAVSLRADANARAALVAESTLRAGQQVVARASATTTVYAAPTFAYALTTADDPVGPGQTAMFRLTVTNLTNAAQDASLSLRVPDFTFYGAYGAGSLRPVAFAAVAPGASASALLGLAVTDDAQAPPDGTLISFTLTDAARGAAVSSTIVTDATPTATLKLATNQASVAAGGAFGYTLAFHNAGAGPLADVELSLPVPVGANFVGADGGGVLGGDGIVRWPLGTLAGGATGHVTVDLTATAGARAALLVESTLRATGQIVARASATTAVYAAPTFAYALTTAEDPVGPGQTATFRLTVTNLTNAPQNANLSLRVPNFTFYGAYGPGTLRPVAFSNVAAGASQSALMNLAVTTGALAPPDGTLVDFTLTDTARGAAVSRTIVTDATPAAALKIATTQATVAPGGAFGYTLAHHNVGVDALADVELSLPVPVGATFVSADGGGVLGGDGFVRWSLGTLAGHATGQVTVSFTAHADVESVLVAEGTLRAGAQIVARASTTTAVYALPTFAYTLTTNDDPVGPGQTATFTLKVTNLTNAPRNAALSLRVPEFTTYGAYGAGTIRPLAFTGIAAGAAQSANVVLTVANGAQAPAPGSLISLPITDGSQGATLTRTIVVN